jgi:dipeptide/tripeptide permease
MFIFMAYFAALPGGYISDSFLGMIQFAIILTLPIVMTYIALTGWVTLGKYKTIISLGMVYVLGSALLAVFAFPVIAYAFSSEDQENYTVGRWGNGLALFLVALGTGGKTPNYIHI